MDSLEQTKEPVVEEEAKTKKPKTKKISSKTQKVGETAFIPGTEPPEEKRRRSLGEIRIMSVKEGQALEPVKHDEFLTTSDAKRWLTKALDSGALGTGEYSIIRHVQTVLAEVETVRKVSIREA